jgi:hypothetical protein
MNTMSTAKPDDDNLKEAVGLLGEAIVHLRAALDDAENTDSDIDLFLARLYVFETAKLIEERECPSAPAIGGQHWSLS